MDSGGRELASSSPSVRQKPGAWALMVCIREERKLLLSKFFMEEAGDKFGWGIGLTCGRIWIIIV